MSQQSSPAEALLDAGRRRRIATSDLRELLRPFNLDHQIRRSGSGSTTTNLVFTTENAALRASALIAEAWGGDSVELQSTPRGPRLRVARDITCYGSWPSGWRKTLPVKTPVGSARHPRDPLDLDVGPDDVTRF